MLIAQVSDPHLRPPGALYQGIVDANAMFAAALEHLARLDPQPDLVLLTGDVTDCATPAAYAVTRDLLVSVRPPILAIPGNHDERDAFRTAFADHAHLPQTGPLHFVADDHGPVRIVALDVTVPGEHHGLMDEDSARWLDGVLAQQPDRPTLIMMHQPPMLSGIAALDPYGCREGDLLARVVARYPAVERILCGHVHRFMMRRFAGTVLCTAPSTTTAIALRLDPEAPGASHIEPPAFLLHHFTPEAGLVTHLVPIGTFPGPFPFA